MRFFYSTARAAKAVGMGTGQFRRLAEAAGIEPFVFRSTSGFLTRYFWGRPAVEHVGRIPRVPGRKRKEVSQ